MAIERRWQDAEVKDRNDALLVRTKAKVWRRAIDSRAGSGGQTYDWDGACSMNAAPFLVGQQNKVLTIGDETWRVVDAKLWAVLGYVELGLVQVKADG